MSDPADLERVPLKVVPMYIDDQPPAEPVNAEERDADGRPRGDRASRRRVLHLLGPAAAAVAGIALVMQVIAIVVASANDFATGTVLGYLAIALAVVGVAGGIVAVVTHRGRRAGVVGIVIGVVANPLIVLGVLRLLDGLRS